MCTDEQKAVDQAKFDEITRLLKLQVSRPPIDQLIQISDNQGWQMDYRERKHVFLWLPGSSINFNFGEYGTGPIQSQVWINLGIREGIKIFTSGQGNTLNTVILRFTDEELP